MLAYLIGLVPNIKNRRSVYVRRIIKNIIYESPKTADDLVNLVRRQYRNSKSYGEIAAICNTDPDIQRMYESTRAARWGLRSVILERWGDPTYFEDEERDYLTAKALSNNLDPNRRSEFEFFKSLRDIINEEG